MFGDASDSFESYQIVVVPTAVGNFEMNEFWKYSQSMKTFISNLIVGYDNEKIIQILSDWSFESFRMWIVDESVRLLYAL